MALMAACLLSVTRYCSSMACSESLSECLETHISMMSHSLIFCRLAAGVAFQADVSTSRPLDVSLNSHRRRKKLENITKVTRNILNYNL